MLEPDTLPCLSSSGVGDARRVERTDMTDAVLMEVDNHEPQVGEKRKMDKGKGVAGDDAKKNQMWVEKYRPSRLADVAAHKDIIDTISRLTKEDRLPHLLLYGPPGTGKTSTILAVARELYGSNFSQMVLELNASDGASRDRRPPPPARSRRARFHFKIAIAPRARSPVAPILLPPKRRFRGPPTRRVSRALRAHLTFPSLVFAPRPRYRRRAQRDPGVRVHDALLLHRLQAHHPRRVRLDDERRAPALRRVIEKYTKHTRFCLIGNYVSKVIPALQSRCTRFRFAPLGPEAVRERVQHVVDAEGLAISPEGVAATQKLGAGDMRRTLNILQSTFLSKKGAGTIEADDVYATTGQPRPEDIEAIAGFLLNEPFAEAAAKVSAVKTERGLALADIVRLLCEYVFRLHMPPNARAALISAMADVEHRLAYVTAERVQLLALVGAFSEAKEAIVAAAE